MRPRTELRAARSDEGAQVSGAVDGGVGAAFRQRSRCQCEGSLRRDGRARSTRDPRSVTR